MNPTAAEILHQLMGDDTYVSVPVHGNDEEGRPLVLSWTDQEIEWITRAARTNTSIEDLTINVDYLSLGSLKPFTTLLECSSVLSELVISFGLPAMHATTVDPCRAAEIKLILSRLLSSAAKNAKSRLSRFRLEVRNSICFDVLLLENLASLPFLKTFEINRYCLSFRLDHGDAFALGQTLLSMKSLERVDLTVCGEGVPILLCQLKLLPFTLKELVLRVGNMANEISEALNLASSDVKVEELTLFGDRSLAASYEFPVPPFVSNLQSLNLLDIDMAPRVRLCPNTTLAQLALFRCKFTEQDILVSFASLYGLKKLKWTEGDLPGAAFALPASLEEVNFSRCRGVGHHVFTSLVPLANLKSFCLFDCEGEGLGETQNWDFLSRLSQLEELSVTAPRNITDLVRNAPLRLILAIDLTLGYTE